MISDLTRNIILFVVDYFETVVWTAPSFKNNLNTTSSIWKYEQRERKGKK